MVAITTLLCITVAQLSLTVYAVKCNTHTLYCGHTLKRGRGWSNKDIQDKVFISEWNDRNFPNEDQIDNSLFKCGGQGEALVWVNGRTPCSGHCEDSKSSASDYCA